MITEPDTGLVDSYKEAIQNGLLLVRHCRSCGEHHDYPRQYCPFCGSGATEWVSSDGSAHVFSFTIWRRKSGPFVAAFVTLREGPTTLAILGGDDAQDVAIGDRVILDGLSGENGLPVFSRAAAQRSDNAAKHNDR